MKHFKRMALCCTFVICTKSYAGIMRADVDVQEYRDFAGVSSLGHATLVSPSYIVSVRHNRGVSILALVLRTF